MIIYLKGEHVIKGKICSDSKEQRHHFSVPSEDNSEVIIEIIPEESKVESSYEFNISNEFWTSIENDIDEKNLPEEFEKILLEKKSVISNAAQKVLGIIKYCFNCTTLEEDLLSCSRIYWSKNKSEWKNFCTKPHVSFDIRGIVNLNEKNAKSIQGYIDNDFRPFLALKHLHRAINETNTRYKWIDATIAAELAIKEFLIRYEPSIETLLLEVPSPPLHKLYGNILKSYTNELSPKLKELNKGVEIRNKLVHRPQDIQITTEDANKYIHDVETSIYHLLHLLYPSDSFVSTF
jgi:hypothetical protein